MPRRVFTESRQRHPQSKSSRSMRVRRALLDRGLPRPPGRAEQFRGGTRVTDSGPRRLQRHHPRREPGDSNQGGVGKTLEVAQGTVGPPAPLLMFAADWSLFCLWIARTICVAQTLALSSLQAL